MDVDERSSIRIIKRGPCLPALLLVLKARGSLAVFPQNWLASSLADNQRGTVGKADLKQQHCDWNSGASFFFCLFPEPSSNSVMLSSSFHISKKRS